MTSDYLANRFSTVFSDSELSRITIKENDSEKTVIIDVHGLNIIQAERFIQNLINLGLGECFTLTIIHGYRHGVAIKTMLEGYTHTHIIQKYYDSQNPGVTHLSVA